MRQSNLSKFSIQSLFGDRNVSISFKSDVKILIGENGLGKTTVLNILYYILSDKLYKLREFDFKSIELEFTDGASIILEKESLLGFDDELEMNVPPSLLNNLSRNLNASELNEFRELFAKGAPTGLIMDRLESRIYHSEVYRRYPGRIIVRAIKIICGAGENNEAIRKARAVLQNELIDTEVLYFPTFRRIEEDLLNLGIQDEKSKINENDARLIQFGMRDVKERLDEVKKEINSLSSRGLSQISSEILSQLVRGVPNLNRNTFHNISRTDINIILARVGEAISAEDKKKITDIVSQKKFDDIENKYLLYFLQKLLSIYEAQRGIDSSIEKFVSACNRYLAYSNKEIQYEASEVDFYLISNKKGNRVLLDELLSKLSSGEKQIISLFSKIHLSTQKDFVVLFDEPELSLSIFWQQLLLPDIVNSGKCKFLLSVTHSPFIFENELAKYAVGLNEYIKFA